MPPPLTRQGGHGLALAPSGCAGSLERLPSSGEPLDLDSALGLRIVPFHSFPGLVLVFSAAACESFLPTAKNFM